jgi:Ca2+-binding RTX toxin-like protein
MAVIIGTDAGETIGDTSDGDQIDGRGGADRITVTRGADSVDGGSGGDTLIVDYADELQSVLSGVDFDASFGGGFSGSFGNGANRSVEFQHIERFTVMTGSGDDLIFTGSGDDEISSGAGDDLLDGLGGTNTLNGGAGNDIIFVNSPSDVVVEATDEGDDIVYARTSYVLAAAAEVEILAAAFQAGSDPLRLFGNGLTNRLFGNRGNNLLDGGGGGDLMYGFAGDDTYFVNAASDGVFEAEGEGNDTAFARVSYTLARGSHVETLSAAFQGGTGLLDLTGNELANTVIGNAGTNVIDGGGGGDVMNGLAGDDIYFVNAASDIVLEGSSGGNDIVYARVSYTLTAAAQVEALAAAFQASTAAIDLTGNDFPNTLLGNDGANFLDGRSGPDFLMGLGGADTFAFTTRSGGDARRNVDTIADFVSGVDRIALDGKIFGLTPGALPASAFVFVTAGDLVAARDSDDRIIYNAKTGDLLFDVDGKVANGAGIALFAVLRDAPALDASDFIVI